jgi:hypothetical protein
MSGYAQGLWIGDSLRNTVYPERTFTQMLNNCGFENVMEHNAGRVRWLWKSMVCRAERPAVTWEKGEQPSLEPTA